MPAVASLQIPQTDRVVFFDTTLRDGEQSPGCTMHHDEKLRMAHQLAALGVDILEAGFAIASEGDSESIRTIAREVGSTGPVIASLARCKREDIEAAARSIEPAHRARIHTFLSTSDLHLAAKLKITRERGPRPDRRDGRPRPHLLPTTSSSPPRTPPAPTPTSSSRSARSPSRPEPPRSTCPTPSATASRRTTRRCSATSARASPASKNIILSAHCHDDLGLAVANTLASVQAGVRQVECAINGIGERAGNAALEEIAAIFTMRRDKLPYTHNIVMSKLYPTSQMLAECISFGAAPNKAIVGSQRLRPRRRHPPARRDGQPAHLRDHDARVRRRRPTTHSSSANTPAAARSNSASPNSATRSPASSSTTSTPASPNSPTAKKPSTTRTSRPARTRRRPHRMSRCHERKSLTSSRAMTVA